MAAPLNVAVTLNGTLTINGVISGDNYLFTTAPGTVILAAANTYTGGTLINSGTLKLANDNALIPGNNGLLVNGSAAVLDLNGHSITVGQVGLMDGSIINSDPIIPATLTGTEYVVLNGSIKVPLGNAAPIIKGTEGTVTLASAGAWDPILSGGGADIRAGKIVLDYSFTGGSTPAATINGLLHDSYHGGLWDVGQIKSSTAAANGSTLGWSDDTSAKKITLMPALPADFNLDGAVDGIDRQTLLDNTGTGTTWQQGDANYDGAVDSLDRAIWWTYAFSSWASAPPTVAAIARLGGDPTAANSLQYVVFFTRGVSGVDPSDFQLDGEGVTGTIASVVDDSPSHAIYLVTVNNVDGSGTLGLNLIDDPNDTSNPSPILDSDGHRLDHTGFTDDTVFVGDVYTVGTPLLAPPTNLVSRIVSGIEANLTWCDESVGLSGFSIEQWIGGGWQEVQTVDANARSATIPGPFAPGIEFPFRVKAFTQTAAGQGGYYYNSSEPSNVATAWPGNWPPAPTGLIANPVSNSQVNLTWTDNASNETGYIVERSGDGRTWTLLTITAANVTSYSDMGLSGTQYYYRVRAINYGGSSGCSYASAGRYLWTGGGLDGNWSTPANWLCGVIPPAGSALYFAGTPSQHGCIDDRTGVAFQSIEFAASGFSISGTGALAVTSSISVDAGVGDAAITMNVTVNSAVTVDVADADASLAISGLLGSGDLTKTGDGTLAITSDSHSGATAVTAGTLLVGSLPSVFADSLQSGVTFNTLLSSAVVVGDPGDSGGSFDWLGGTAPTITGGSLALDPNTGILQWTPGSGCQAGSYHVTVTYSYTGGEQVRAFPINIPGRTPRRCST